MNTLRELGEFVGISQGSLQVHRFGGPPVITLKNVSVLVMNGKRTVPIRALIQALQKPHGNLLTTSATPGHAMKAVDPSRAFGAVIGKSLRRFSEDQVLIPILIALQ